MQSENAVSSAGNNMPQGRLASLDALRGADMFFLVAIVGIVRTLPKLSDHPTFQMLADQCAHPKWHGFTALDVIFPLFIFIMGVAMPFSFAKRLERDGRAKVFGHLFTRAVVLFLLGLVFWGTPPGSENHGWGFYSVLYRIGFSYLFAGLIVLNFKPRAQVFWAFGLVFGYWLAMRFIPVPGFGAGNFSEDGNLVAFVTGWLEGVIPPSTKHLLSPTLIPSVANALFGALAGQWLRSEKSPTQKTLGLLLVGGLFVALSFPIHQSFPLCKKLLSTSFTFLTCGLSMLLLGLFYWIIDVQGYRRWSFFFIVVGMNSITIYLGARYIDFSKLSGVFIGAFTPLLGPAQPLAMAITSATLMWLFLHFLYRHKVFLKV